MKEIRIVLLVGGTALLIWLIICNAIFLSNNPNCPHSGIVQHTFEFVSWGDVECIEEGVDMGSCIE